MASKKNREDDDRLSSLPDCVLQHILSFLDTRHAARTSILSCRWRDLWTFIPNLNFNIYYDDASDFTRFVYRAFANHAAPKIHSFRLSFDYLEEHTSDVDAWIRLAVRKGVEELNIDMHETLYSHEYQLPCWLFKCDTLASLKLRGCSFRDVKFSLFSSIIKLSLSEMIFNNEEFQDLLAGCPLLEDLVIVDCHMKNIFISSSSNPRLKNLKVEVRCIKRVEVDAPHLQFLKFSGEPGYCSFKEFSSLTEARLLDLEPFYSGYNGAHLSFLEPSVQNLRHAKLLELPSCCIQVMNTPTFTDLHSYIFKTKFLVLETGLYEVELPGIANLLWSSPDLETLVINLLPRGVLVYGSNDEESLTREYWESLTVPFPCLVHRLKSIKITNLLQEEHDSFRDISREMNLVRFLLRNAMVLKKITIHASGKPRCVKKNEWIKLVLKVTQELLAIPRASPLVDVVFVHK